MEEKEWFLYVADHHEGPFSVAEIKNLVNQGEARKDSFVWKRGYHDWVMMTDVTEFGEGSAKSDGHGKPKFDTKSVVQVAQKTNSTSSAPQAALDSVSPQAAVWCLNSNQSFSGPHTMKEIAARISRGEAKPKDQVWREGWQRFATIESLPDFMSLVATEGVSRPMSGVGPETEIKPHLDPATLSALQNEVSSAPGFGPTSVNTVVPSPAAVDTRPAESAAATGEPASPPEQRTRARAALLPLGVGGIVLALGGVAYWFAHGNHHGLHTPKRARHALRLSAIAAYLPSPLARLLSPIELPEGVSPQDAEALKSAATAEPKSGLKIATALVPGDELNPSFVIATNAPQGMHLNLVLTSKEGTLLNTSTYKKTLSVEVSKSVIIAPRFFLEESKPLSKGEYTLEVFQSDGTSPALTEHYFLGGKRDALYETRLTEFNERIRANRAEQIAQAGQITRTLESMANESATKFYALAQLRPSPQRKVKWAQYHNQYAQLSGQLKSLLVKMNAEAAQSGPQLAEIERNLMDAYRLSESLHGMQHEFMEKHGFIPKNGKLDASFTDLAGQTLRALGSVKTALAKGTP